MGRIGFEGSPVTGFGVRRTPQHLEHQRSVRQRSGARRTGGAFEHLIEEPQRALRISGHGEGGGGGGADPGRDPGAARRQNAVEEPGRGGRIPFPQPGVREPAGRAQRGAFQRLVGLGYQRDEHAGSRARLPGEQMHAGLPDGEHRVRGIPERGRPRHPRRLREIPAVEQESEQFRPFVPAPFAERREQQVPTAGPEPARLVTREEAPPLGGQGGIRILGEQLAEAEPGGGVPRRFRDGPAKPPNRFAAPSEEREGAAELLGGAGRRARRGEGGFEERQGARVVVRFDSQPRAFQDRGGQLAWDRRTEDAARLGQEARSAKLRRQFHPGLLGKPLVEVEQRGDGHPRLVVAAQDGEQPDAERQAVRVRARTRERGHRRRVIEKPHMGLGAQAEQRRVRSVRPGRIEYREDGREVLGAEQLADLGLQARVRLREPRRSPEQQGECEGRHGRWSATLPVRASR